MKIAFMIFCLFVYTGVALALFDQIIRSVAKKKEGITPSDSMMYRCMCVIWPVTLIVCLPILLFSKNVKRE